MVHRLDVRRREAWLLAVGLQVLSPGRGRMQARASSWATVVVSLPPDFLTLLSLSIPSLL